MRKTWKVLHTLSACGLIGGLGCYMILLVSATQEMPVAYADTRHAILAISNYVLLPSLAVVLVTGLFSMASHPPFLDQKWVWFKAAMGFVLFKAILTIIGTMADEAAVLSREIAKGESSAGALSAVLTHEWFALGLVMAISAASVVLGVWRPRFAGRPAARVKESLEIVPTRATGHARIGGNDG